MMMPIRALYMAMGTALMSASTELPENLVPHLSGMGIAVDEDLWVRDWSGKFPNFADDGLVWVFDPSSGRSLMMLRGRDMEWTVVNEPRDLKTVSAVMTVPAEDDASAVKRFMRHLVQLLHDPRVKVCDPVLARQPDLVIETYLVDGGPGIDALRAECANPPSIERGDSGWRGIISILDDRGALLEVRAAGELGNDTVESFEARTIFPEGSFFFADEF